MSNISINPIVSNGGPSIDWTHYSDTFQPVSGASVVSFNGFNAITYFDILILRFDFSNLYVSKTDEYNPVYFLFANYSTINNAVEYFQYSITLNTSTRIGYFFNKTYFGSIYERRNNETIKIMTTSGKVLFDANNKIYVGQVWANGADKVNFNGTVAIEAYVGKYRY